MTVMMRLQETDAITIIKTAVEASRAAGQDYVEAAFVNLSNTRLTDAEIDEFLMYCGSNKHLINTIFKTSSADPQHSLRILEQSGYEEMLCLSAGESHENNEEFLVTLLVSVYAKNATRGRRLTKRFEKSISQQGAIALCRHSNNDPGISKILYHALQRVT